MKRYQDNRLKGIKKDIRQGKEYEIIALKWDIKHSYVIKIASMMKKQGEELVDRRSKKWRTLMKFTRDHFKWYHK